jgi:tyrosyl-tRNA synthetase
MPLLEGLDGVQKMSKSLDNYIGIDESPAVMYRKAMAVPDNLILRYLQLTTDATPAEIANEARVLREGGNPRDVKARLAERLVHQFHPNASPDAYRDEGGAFRGAEPEELSLIAGERTIAQLFVDAGLASSKGEARRLAGQHGITINGQPVASAEEKVTPQDGWVLRRGAHRVVRLKLR